MLSNQVEHGKENVGVIIWLKIVCAMIILMIVVGGVTRLTESGLSMVDWRPIMGTLPPMSDSEWQSVFQAYQQFPEYQKTNQHMTLEGDLLLGVWSPVAGPTYWPGLFLPAHCLFWSGENSWKPWPQTCCWTDTGGAAGVDGLVYGPKRVD